MPHHHVLPFILIVLLAAISPSCSRHQPVSQPPDSSSAQVSNLPTGAQQVAEAEDGQWVMAAKNYSSTRYSGLPEINTENARDLKVAWTFSTGTNRGQEAAPIVANNTMYVVTPYPNILFAFDLSMSCDLLEVFRA